MLISGQRKALKLTCRCSAWPHHGGEKEENISAHLYQWIWVRNPRIKEIFHFKCELKFKEVQTCRHLAWYPMRHQYRAKSIQRGQHTKWQMAALLSRQNKEGLWGVRKWEQYMDQQLCFHGPPGTCVIHYQKWWPWSVLGPWVGPIMFIIHNKLCGGLIGPMDQ